MSTSAATDAKQETNAKIEQLIQLVSEPLSRPIDDLPLLRQSLLFAELSHLSYFNPADVSRAVKAFGLDDYQYIERGNGQAYVFSTNYDCVVVFRGTEQDDVEDIKADVDAVMVVAETVGRVHRGFKREVDELWGPVESALRENTKPLWFAGHSLGGAMATISAGRCILSSIPSNPEGLFTFGSPRVGNRRYINFVKMNHYRWVNNNDIVTRLPPRWLGYSHAGRELYLDAYGKLRNYTTWRKFRDRWLGFFLSLRRWKVDHFSDHSITSYIQYIHQAIIEEEQGRLKPLAKGNSAARNSR